MFRNFDIYIKKKKGKKEGKEKKNAFRPRFDATSYSMCTHFIAGTERKPQYCLFKNCLISSTLKPCINAGVQK